MDCNDHRPFPNQFTGDYHCIFCGHAFVSKGSEREATINELLSVIYQTDPEVPLSSNEGVIVWAVAEIEKLK